MEYVAYLTYQPDQRWQAVIPDLPDCVVNAETRAEALEQIKLRALSFVQQTEQVRIELSPADSLSGEETANLDLKALGYGAFKDDPTWGELFDEIERQRDEQLAGKV